MGETGCGKTRLIRYMCDLDAHLAKSQEARNNMLVLKVQECIHVDLRFEVNCCITANLWYNCNDHRYMEGPLKKI